MILAATLLAALPAGALAGRAWHFTDIHVDPVYVVNSSVFSYCNGAVTTNVSNRAGEFGNSTGDCATPYSLFRSAVDFVLNELDPVDVVLFTGDFTQAGLKSEDEVLDTINQTHAELRAALPPAVKIFGSVGNHDAYPGDVFPYPFPGGYDVLADSWSLDDAAKTTVRDGGYYAVRLDDEEEETSDGGGLVVLGVNTMYWTTLNPHLKNSSDPAYAFGFAQMAWFAGELQRAKDGGQTVWILGHVPGELWLPELSHRYQELIQAFSSTVAGQFFGHDHQDGVKLTRECDDATSSSSTTTTTSGCTGEPTGFVWVGPSLTEGWPSENPALRVYEFDDASFEINAALTYSTDLMRANEAGNVTWQLEYNTTEALSMADLSAASWASYIARVGTSEEEFQAYLDRRRRNYSGPRSASSGVPCSGLGQPCAAAELCYLAHFADADAAAANCTPQVKAKY